MRFGEESTAGQIRTFPDPPAVAVPACVVIVRCVPCQRVSGVYLGVPHYRVYVRHEI